jgi:hypothetical protein
MAGPASEDIRNANGDRRDHSGKAPDMDRVFHVLIGDLGAVPGVAIKTVSLRTVEGCAGDRRAVLT